MKKLKKYASIGIAVIMTVLFMSPQRIEADEFDPGFNCGFTFQVDGWYNNAKTYYKVSCGDKNTGYVQLETDPEWNGAWFTIAPQIAALAINPANYDDISITFKIECGVADPYENKKSVMCAWERYVDDLGNFHEEEVFSHVSETSDFVWEYTMDHVKTTNYHDYVVALDYENGGNPAIMEQMQQNIFAYELKDYDQDSDADQDDIKYALATEIYIKFFAVNSYEYFGLDRGEYSATAVSQLRDKITLTDAADTSMSNASGSAVAVTTKTATVNFGVSMFDGSPVSVTTPVYIVEEGDFVYNVNGTYYIRNIHSDPIDFTDGGDGGFIIVTNNDISNVLGGGSGSDRFVYNTSAGLYSMDLNTVTDFLRNGSGPRYGAVNWDYGTHVRVMKKTGTYVKIDTNNPDGENKQYDPLKLENGHYADDIWETGTGRTAIVFVGEKKINLRPLSTSVKEKGVDTISITDVRLADENQALGVVINKENIDDISIEFLSNFYDSVKFIITYEGNIERELTIIRQGLVIDYVYLFDQGEGDNTDTYRRDCYGGTGPALTYNYWEGQQIAVMATYYHPSTDNTKSGKDDLKMVVSYADGATEILNKFEHMSGSPYCAVDTTYFLLGFLPAHDDNGPITHQTFTRNGHTGAINAIVVNGGYNDPDTFGGTQIGSGKGVYWNGSVDWFN